MLYYTKELPAEHVARMQELYKKDITDSIVGTKWIHTDYEQVYFDEEWQYQYNTEYYLLDATTDKGLVFAVQNHLCTNDAAILNFASATTPGGGYINGAMAQEEALCSVSTLYNVLSTFNKSVYAEQRKHNQQSLYMQSILYTPQILFETSIGNVFADVITCAAPNCRVAIQKGVSLEQIQQVMYNRIDYLLKAAAEQSTSQCLILGAFGCGVFGNSPDYVAKTFMQLLKTKYIGVFKNVLFAIPDKNSKNYKAFLNFWQNDAQIVLSR